VRTGEPGLTYPATTPVKRIDFVTSSLNTTVRTALTESDPSLVAASDHRAVSASIALNQGSESSR
jgi:endonuclease/exonuclease/phosphatase family metal-dependent hydrolase